VALTGWLLDKSAAVRLKDPAVRSQLADVIADLFVCPVGQLEQLYSAQSAREYDRTAEQLDSEFDTVDAPPDVLNRALQLQRDLAHHRGLWHRMPIPDLLIAETALYHDLGVVHVDRDFERIAEVRSLAVRRLG
jgi:predicted nucleic acid-binding protein